MSAPLLHPFSTPLSTPFSLSRRRCLQGLASAGIALHAPGVWAAKPARMISLSGALTEVVYLLSAQDQLVATDTTSLYPEAALRTPKVGYMRQLAAEGVLSLRPDVVIGTQEAGPAVVLDQIRQAGVRVALLPVTHDWSEVMAKVTMVGRETGREAQAAQLAQRLDGEWAGVQAQVAKAARKPRALFILSHGGAPQVAGRATAADALIRYAGGVNAIGQFQGYRALTAEAMASAAPDVIINSTQGIEALGGEAAFWTRPELTLTPAFARKALVTLDASHLLGFGPRMPSAVKTVHERMQAFVA